MDLDTSLARTFLVVSEELHFGRAAQRLGISQQAVTQRIVRLEQWCGCALLDRSDRRRIRVTTDGTALLPAARGVVEATDRLGTAVARRRPLKVDPMSTVVTPIRWVRAAHEAGVLLSVVERPSTMSATEAITSGVADLAFGRLTETLPPGVEARPVLFEAIELMCGPAHPFHAREEVTLAELAHQKLEVPLDGAPREWQLLVSELCSDFGLDADFTGSTLGYDYWTDRTLDGQGGLTLIGAEMSLPDRARTVGLTAPIPVFPWWACWRTGVDAAGVLEWTPMPAQVPRLALDPDSTWLPATDRTALNPDPLRTRPSESR